MSFQALRKMIQQSPNILITAGAGMGVDSGLPDFRGKNGFWRVYPLFEELNISIEEIASVESFKTSPKLVWAFYLHRQNLYREATPHYGFDLLRELVKDKDYFILTSNIDEQFQKAGFKEEKIYECHGNLNYFQCLKNCSDLIWRNESVFEVDLQNFKVDNPPVCPLCGGMARPNIVLFSDWYFNDNRTHKQEHKFRKWIKEKLRERLVIIEIGAGLAIPTIREWGEKIAKRGHDATLIRINPNDFEIDDRLGVGLEMGGLEGLKLLLEP